MKNLSSAFLKLFQREAKLDKVLGIHYNGEDNLYPDYIEGLISNSVTALECADLMTSFLVGRGFDNANNTIVDPANDTTLLEFLGDVAESVAKHRGAFIHVNYDEDYKAKSYKVLPYTDCRVGKTDDNDYSGKIHVCSDWSKDKEAKKASKIDVYNSKEVVIKEQVKAAGGFSKYKGQILFYNTSKLIYPISRIHAVNEDCESEKRASMYKGVSLRKGFFGKTLVVTKPLVDTDYDKENQDDVAEYKKQLDARTEFRKTIQKFIGAENVDGVMHMELDFQEDVNDEILFKNIDSNIDDKLFAFTEKSVRDNIRIAFKNIPAPLIASQDGKMFNSSGEAIRAMRIFYQEQTEKERMQLQQLVLKLMSSFNEPLDGLEIVPLIDTTKVDIKNKK